MLFLSCTFITSFLILLGSTTNGLCILVFLRQKFRHRIITPYFIVLLIADSIYLAFRLIKLLYYSQTLLKWTVNSTESCSNSFFARIYQYASQTLPQTLIPFIQSETYIRFSLILMCIVSVQRTNVIRHSLKRLSRPETSLDSTKHRWTFFFIIVAFLLAFLLEFFGLTIFCSKSLSRKMSFDWFVYMNTQMENVTHLFLNSMENQTKSIECVQDVMKNVRQSNETTSIYENVRCEENQFLEIVSKTFDQHQRSIVRLIQRIVHHQTGHRLAPNEIRRKFHFHECFFPQESISFEENYHFLYSRTFGINRFTLILGELINNC